MPQPNDLHQRERGSMPVACSSYQNIGVDDKSGQVTHITGDVSMRTDWENINLRRLASAACMIIVGIQMRTNVRWYGRPPAADCSASPDGVARQRPLPPNCATQPVRASAGWHRPMPGASARAPVKLYRHGDAHDNPAPRSPVGARSKLYDPRRPDHAVLYGAVAGHRQAVQAACVRSRGTLPRVASAASAQSVKTRPARKVATASANSCGIWSGSGTMPPWISASRLPATSRATRAVAG